MEDGKIWVGCLMDLMSLVEVANEASVQVRFISGFESLFVSKTIWKDRLVGPLAQSVRATDSYRVVHC